LRQENGESTLVASIYYFFNCDLISFCISFPFNPGILFEGIGSDVTGIVPETPITQ
jgi:hypothetical protein